jgi:hypothetical protein
MVTISVQRASQLDYRLRFSSTANNTDLPIRTSPTILNLSAVLRPN